MPSLTASFVDVLDQSVNFTHLCARHYVVNVLVPALAKLAAQLVADLLIAADPPAAAHLLGQFLRAHAHAQHLPDLEARCRLSLWRTAQRLAKPLEQQHARLRAQPCTARPCSEGCLRSHAAISMPTLAVRLDELTRDGSATTALPCRRVVTLFLRGPR